MRFTRDLRRRVRRHFRKVQPQNPTRRQQAMVALMVVSLVANVMALEASSRAWWALPVTLWMVGVHTHHVVALLVPAVAVVVPVAPAVVVAVLGAYVLFFVVVTVQGWCAEDNTECATDDWCALQVCRSVNYGVGSWFSFYASGGHNLQIEGRLFPAVHRCHYPALQPIVEDTCRMHGIPYRTGSFAHVFVGKFCVPKHAHSSNRPRHQESGLCGGPS